LTRIYGDFDKIIVIISVSSGEFLWHLSWTWGSDHVTWQKLGSGQYKGSYGKEGIDFNFFWELHPFQFFEMKHPFQLIFWFGKT